MTEQKEDKKRRTTMMPAAPVQSRPLTNPFFRELKAADLLAAQQWQILISPAERTHA